jgi:hypothetical protein
MSGPCPSRPSGSEWRGADRRPVNRGFGSRAKCLSPKRGGNYQPPRRWSSSASPSSTCTTVGPRTARSKSPMPISSCMASGECPSGPQSRVPSTTASSPSRSQGAGRAARTDGPRTTRLHGSRSRTEAHRRMHGGGVSRRLPIPKILEVVAESLPGGMAEIQWGLVAETLLASVAKRYWLRAKTLPGKINTPGGGHEPQRHDRRTGAAPYRVISFHKRRTSARKRERHG